MLAAHRLVRNKAKWIVLVLIVANEIRGVMVVAAVGWPLLKAMYSLR
jgi:hypothetical protein